MIALEDIEVWPELGGPPWLEVLAVKAQAVAHSWKLRDEATWEAEAEYEPLTWGVNGENPPKVQHWSRDVDDPT